MLELKNISVGYTKRMVLHQVSMHIDPTLMTVVMGANGAGKSTLLKAIYGLLPLKHGTILWEESKLNPSPQSLIEKGIFMIPQGKRVFNTLSVAENIELATHFWKKRSDYPEALEKVLDIFPELKDKLKQTAGNLSGGQQQMVALARGFINNPKLVLLDEPSIGLSPKLINETFYRLKDLNKQRGTGFIIVEHNLKTLLPLTDHAFILDQGTLAYDGKAESKTLDKMLDKIFNRAP